jgi:hypothetical protein
MPMPFLVTVPLPLHPMLVPLPLHPMLVPFSVAMPVPPVPPVPAQSLHLMPVAMQSALVQSDLEHHFEHHLDVRRLAFCRLPSWPRGLMGGQHVLCPHVCVSRSVH